MPKFNSFPHYEINVQDLSVTNPLIVESLALHRPLHMCLCEKGPVGVPVYGDYSELKALFGAGTFDVFSKFYKHPNLFLEKGLAKNKCFVVRLTDAAAESASMVLEAVTYTSDIIQYQKDAEGFRLLDANGDPVPIDNAGSPLTEPGLVVKWQTRPLVAGENPSAITQATNDIVDPNTGATVSATTYPIAVFVTNSPGAWGNSAGIKLSWDADSDASTAVDMSALIFKAEMVTIPWGSDIPTTIRNKYLEPASEFTFKEDSADQDTMRRYYLQEVIAGEYNADEVPYMVSLYPGNVEIIGAAAIAAETINVFNGELVDSEGVALPYMVNLFTGRTLDGHYYDHIAIDTTSAGSILLDADIINYLSGGSDGATDSATMEGLTREWLSGSVYPELIDQARYPMTHLYDSGYELDTKAALIDFLALRDDVKIIMSTQSVYDEPNTKAEDQSTGSFLRGKALIQLESFIYGTEACRVTILQQCGKLNEISSYTDLVPATLDCMLKKGTHQNATYIKGKPKGLPNSEVTVLKDINWFPVQDDFKQLSWDNALNYMQYYDMTSVHYPDVISVYPYKTSLLSDDNFTDYLVYLKHLIRKQWATFVGLDDPITQLFGKITDAISAEVYKTFGSYLRAEVLVYQTDLDVELGYALTVEVRVAGTVPNRVWNVIVPVSRATAA